MRSVGSKPWTLRMCDITQSRCCHNVGDLVWRWSGEVRYDAISVSSDSRIWTSLSCSAWPAVEKSWDWIVDMRLRFRQLQAVRCSQSKRRMICDAIETVLSSTGWAGTLGSESSSHFEAALKNICLAMTKLLTRASLEIPMEQPSWRSGPMPAGRTSNSRMRSRLDEKMSDNCWKTFSEVDIWRGRRESGSRHGGVQYFVFMSASITGRRARQGRSLAERHFLPL